MLAFIIPAKYKKNIFGFSMLEVTLVITIIGILTIIATPSFIKLLDHRRISDAAIAFRSELEMVRSRAMTNPSLHMGVYLNTNENGFLIFYDDNGNNSYDHNGIHADRKHKPLTKLSSGITFSEIPAQWNNCIIYRGDGSTKYGGSFTLKLIKNATKRTLWIKKEFGTVKITK